MNRKLKKWFTTIFRSLIFGFVHVPITPAFVLVCCYKFIKSFYLFEAFLPQAASSGKSIKAPTNEFRATKLGVVITTDDNRQQQQQQQQQQQRQQRMTTATDDNNNNNQQK